MNEIQYSNLTFGRSNHLIVIMLHIALNGLMWYSLATGNNMILPSVNIMDKVSTTLLPDTGIFPTKFLIFPLMVGAAVVGSFERRISGWIKKTKTN